MQLSDLQFPQVHTVKRRQGFTIVELLIVVVVIAILATITIIAYNGIQQRAKTAVVNNTANEWVKVIQNQLTLGAQISTGTTCLGQSANDFPADGTFGAQECLLVFQNGSKIMTVSYDSSVFANWQGGGTPPKGLLPTTTANLTISGNNYVYKARGVWGSVSNGAASVGYIPVVQGQCGAGASSAGSSFLTGGPYGGDVCTINF